MKTQPIKKFSSARWHFACSWLFLPDLAWCWACGLVGGYFSLFLRLKTTFFVCLLHGLFVFAPKALFLLLLRFRFRNGDFRCPGCVHVPGLRGNTLGRTRHPSRNLWITLLCNNRRIRYYSWWGKARHGSGDHAKKAQKAVFHYQFSFLACMHDASGFKSTSVDTDSDMCAFKTVKCIYATSPLVELGVQSKRTEILRWTTPRVTRPRRTHWHQQRRSQRSRELRRESKRERERERERARERERES